MHARHQPADDGCIRDVLADREPALVALVPQEGPGFLLHLHEVGAIEDRGVAPVDRDEPLLAVVARSVDRL
jgi:hypothetical protein